VRSAATLQPPLLVLLMLLVLLAPLVLLVLLALALPPKQMDQTA
jgi:hypothetical protein